MKTYVNEAHNELVEVENRLSDLYRDANDLSNWLYQRNPEHPLLDEVSSLSSHLEQIDYMEPYKAEQSDAGEAWWDER